MNIVSKCILQSLQDYQVQVFAQDLTTLTVPDTQEHEDTSMITTYSVTHSSNSPTVLDQTLQTIRH